MQNMEGEEERGSVGEENSQKDAATDETSRQTERSQNPQLRSDRGSDDDDDKEDEREEQTSGSLWGHARLPPSVYGNNPPPGGKRMGKANAVWEVVKHLKERTVDGEVVDAKYSHVCISPITAAEAGEQGPDVDSHGNSLWFCNKLFSLSKTKNCYRSSQATKHCGQFHGETSAAGKAIRERASKNNAQKRNVMEASSHKAGPHNTSAQNTSGARSGAAASGPRTGAAAQYTITNLRWDSRAGSRPGPRDPGLQKPWIPGTDLGQGQIPQFYSIRLNFFAVTLS